MRIDKFLKVSRIIKRRAIAADACDGGRIEVNGKVAKPAKNLAVGDIVTVAFGVKKLSFRVLFVDEKSARAEGKEMYEVVENC